MPDGDKIPPLPQGYEAINKTSSTPPLPNGYFDVKKKVGSSDNGIGSFDGLNIKAPTGTISNQQVLDAQRHTNNNAFTQEQQTIVENKGQYDKNQIHQAAINTATNYFKNNPVLLEGINKLKKDNTISLKNAPEKEDIYSLKNLKNVSLFEKKVAEVKRAYDNGDLALTQFQNGEKAGEPVFTQPAKFLRGVGQGIENSFGETKDAIVGMASSDKDFADYLDQKQRGLPDIPSEAPAGYSNAIGNTLGSLIKPVAEFSAGEAAVPEGGGLVFAGADIIPSSTTAKTKELYYQRINELRQHYGDNIPENERVKALSDARSNATLQAIPDEAMQLYLFGRGSNALGELENTGLKGFKKSLLKAGADIPKMSALGGLSEGTSQAIKAMQGYNTDDATKRISDAAENWALMETAFKVAHGVMNVPKYIKAQANEVITNADPNVVAQLNKEAISKGWITQEQADKANADLQQYEKIRNTLPENISSDKAAAVTGLLQKNENLEAEKKTLHPIAHDDINLEIENNEAKAKQILNSDKPLKYETDELTGQRGQDVGGRPEKEIEAETKITNEQGNEITQSEQQQTNEGQQKQEDVGEVVQSQYKSSPIGNPSDFVETENAVMEGSETDKIERDNGEASKLPKKGYVVDATYLKEGKEKGKGYGQELYKKALDKYGTLYSYSDIGEDAINAQNALERKGYATIKNINVDGTDFRMIEKPIQTNSIVEDKQSDTPVKDEYKDRIDNLGEGSKQSDVSKLSEGDYVNVPKTDKSSGVKGFVKKVGRTNVVLDTFYQLGSTADDGIMQEITVKKADIKEFLKPKAEYNPIEQDKSSAENKSTGAKSEAENIGSEPISNENQDEAGIHAEKPPFVLTHKGLQELATEVGLEDVTPRERETRLRQLKDANDEIDKWKKEGTYTKNINDVISRAAKGEINERDQKILANHIATLREQREKIGKEKGYNSQEFKDKVDEIYQASQAARAMRSKAGGLLGDKSIGIPDDTLDGFLEQERDINKGAPLTDNQITTAINEYEKINDANDEFKKKYEDLQDKYAKLLAERELKKTQANTKKDTKKTHEDFVKERTGIVKDIREKLKAARQETNVTIVPYAKELIAIAPDVAKLAKSLIEEGITKLDDVVKNIHAQLKEDLPELQEKDVHDIIAGNYNEKKKTRSQVAEQMQDLKIQAQLINKYEALLKGEEPKNEKSKIKRNQEIHDLREKIKGFHKEEKEANAFYGESDANEKRIQAKEDELQRLKDRKQKETTPRERKEISEREQKLNEEILEERKKIKAEEKEANTRYKEEIDPEVKRLQRIKNRNKAELEKVNEQLKKGDFAIPEKRKPLSQDDELKKNFPDAYKEALSSQTKLVKAKNERRLRMALQQFENMSEREKFAKNAVRYLNVPRTLMASMDFSAPLRQGIVVTVAHPVMALKSFATMFEHAWSQDAFDRFYHDVRESPRWQLYQDSKLALTDPHELHLSKEEEAYLGGNVAEKIPILGRGVKASERAYVSYLNKLRMDLFDRFADRLEADGKTFSNSPDLYKAVSSFVNSSTGRGNMAAMENAAPFLSTALFAPRLIASRLNMLGLTDIPNLIVRAATLGTKGIDYGFYTRMPKEIRVAAMVDMLKLIGTGAAFLTAAHYAGADTETDPRSSDFGKIKAGNTRWDIWGGFQPYVRLIAQIASGQSKSANTGKIYDLNGNKFGGRTVGDQLVTFGRGKLSPVFGTVADILTQRTLDQQTVERRFDIPFYPKDNAPEGSITLTDEILKGLTPLLASDISDAMKDKGVAALFTVGVPSVFGVGVQTYEPKASSTSNTRSTRTVPKRTERTHR